MTIGPRIQPIDWLERAEAVRSDERARHLANPEPTRSTKVDPELTEAMLAMRSSVDTLRRTLTTMLTSCTGFEALHSLEYVSGLLADTERRLERVEQMIAGGVR